MEAIGLCTVQTRTGNRMIGGGKEFRVHETFNQRKRIEQLSLIQLVLINEYI